jgi:hypothetical protein
MFTMDDRNWHYSGGLTQRHHLSEKAEKTDFEVLFGPAQFNETGHYQGRTGDGDHDVHNTCYSPPF